jgi:hypothetical protein
MLAMESIGNRKNGEYDNLIMGKTISLGTTCHIWTSLGTGNGEHDYLIVGKTISLGTENGEHDYLIMGKTISLGT